eukprot:5086629-Ditylum_brightwellii.AAC.1
MCSQNSVHRRCLWWNHRGMQGMWGGWGFAWHDKRLGGIVVEGACSSADNALFWSSEGAAFWTSSGDMWGRKSWWGAGP